MIHLGRGARNKAYGKDLSKHENDHRFKMLQIAIKRGQSTRGNHQIIANGVIDWNESFLGPHPVFNGSLKFYYHSNPILGIDMVKKRVTNFGYAGYSISTGQNIDSWESYVALLFPRQFQRYLSYARWLPRRNDPFADGEAAYAESYRRFCTWAPWIVKDAHGDKWVQWNLLDRAAIARYDEGVSFLRNDQNWRYFEYGWDDQGRWERRFKNGQAQVRWTAREKKRVRQREKALDGHLQESV